MAVGFLFASSRLLPSAAACLRRNGLRDSDRLHSETRTYRSNERYEVGGMRGKFSSHCFGTVTCRSPTTTKWASAKAWTRVGLPADTPIKTLVRLAKMRWRIEHDYRELKTGLGLAHFEGRSFTGWHRHATLVTAAHLFITRLRLTRPKRMGQPEPLRHPQRAPTAPRRLPRTLPPLPPTSPNITKYY
jgi:SRSO17 transposase